MTFWNLRKNWFGPDGVRYRTDHNPHEFPDNWVQVPEGEEDEKEELVVAGVPVTRTIKSEEPKRDKDKLYVIPSTAEKLLAKEGEKQADAGRATTATPPHPDVVLKDPATATAPKKEGAMSGDSTSMGGTLTPAGGQSTAPTKESDKAKK